eukprot:g29965.t1
MLQGNLLGCLGLWRGLRSERLGGVSIVSEDEISQGMMPQLLEEALFASWRSRQTCELGGGALERPARLCRRCFGRAGARYVKGCQLGMSYYSQPSFPQLYAAAQASATSQSYGRSAEYPRGYGSAAASPPASAATTAQQAYAAYAAQAAQAAAAAAPRQEASRAIVSTASEDGAFGAFGKKDAQVNGLDVQLYYWDDRDGASFCGWWFGPKVGGDQVWAYHPSSTAMTPPKTGWKVPYDGPVDNSFLISPTTASQTAHVPSSDLSSYSSPQQEEARVRQQEEVKRKAAEQRMKMEEMTRQKMEQEKRLAEERKRQHNEQRAAMTLRHFLAQKIRVAKEEQDLSTAQQERTGFLSPKPQELAELMAQQLPLCGANAEKVQAECAQAVEITMKRIEAGASYGVHDPFFAVTQLAQTSMRSEIGKMTLDRTFEERDAMNQAIVHAVNVAAHAWGIEVLRYEIRDIIPPPSIKQAMEMQAEAERRRRAEVLQSEGDRQSEAKGDAAAIRERARATAEGIEMISAAMRVPGGPDAAKLRVAEQWVAAWKERPPGLIGREEQMKKQKEAQEKAEELLRELGEKVATAEELVEQLTASAEQLCPEKDMKLEIVTKLANSMDSKAAEATGAINDCQSFVKEHGNAMMAMAFSVKPPEGVEADERPANLPTMRLRMAERARMRNMAIEVEDESDSTLLSQPPSANSPAFKNAMAAVLVGVIMSTVVGVTVYQSTRPANSLAMRGARDGLEAQVLSEKSEYLISLGLGSVCRMSPEDTNLVPKKAKECRAMEYRNSEQRCEKWYTPARWHKNLVEHKTVNGNPDFHCLVKSGRCETLKLHKKVLEGEMDELLDHIKNNCMEGPSGDKYNMCSSQYAQSMLNTNKRLCEAMMSSCAEEVQCE